MIGGITMKKAINKCESMTGTLTEKARKSIIDKAKKLVRDKVISGHSLTEEELNMIVDYYIDEYFYGGIEKLQKINRDELPMIYVFFRNYEDLGIYGIDNIKRCGAINIDEERDPFLCHILEQCFDYECFGEIILDNDIGTYVELSDNLIVEYI